MLFTLLTPSHFKWLSNSLQLMKSQVIITNKCRFTLALLIIASARSTTTIPPQQSHLLDTNVLKRSVSLKLKLFENLVTSVEAMTQ